MRSIKKSLREKRHNKIRTNVSGTNKVPRLSVFKSNRHVFVQLIDDKKGNTLAAASDIELGKKGKISTINKKIARELGKLVAKKAKEKKIESVVFDRGGFKYHGIVEELAEGAREGGLKF